MKRFLTLALLALALVVGTAADMIFNPAPATAYQGKDPLVWLMEDKDIEAIIVPDGKREARPALLQLSVDHPKHVALAFFLAPVRADSASYSL
jgi:hypothetical protein